MHDWAYMSSFEKYAIKDLALGSVILDQGENMLIDRKSMPQRRPKKALPSHITPHSD